MINKFLFIGLFPFSLLYADKERDERLQQNSVLYLSTVECIKKYKISFLEMMPILEFIIKKMNEDNDYYGLKGLKNKIDRLKNKENEKEVKKLDLEIDETIRKILK